LGLDERPDEVSRTTDAGQEGGYFGVYAKFGQPPGWRYGEWDFRPSWDYYSQRGEDDLEMRFDASKEAWQMGEQHLLPQQLVSCCISPVWLPPAKRGCTWLVVGRQVVCGREW
jgi:hypothetical protein